MSGDCCDAVEFTDPIAQVIVKDDCTTVVQVTNTTGPQGPPGTAATINVGTTSTLAPGSSATVTNTGTTSAAIFDFGIPEGQQGVQGPQGVQGIPGNAATVNVGTTSTLAPGSAATVTNSGTSSAAVFDFGVPEGVQGPQGPQGESAQREARSDWVSPNSYLGIAAEGSSESASVWRVTRITVTGNTVTTAVASPIRWVDRLTAVYV